MSYGNMMYDPRIVRGNTYRLQNAPTVSCPSILVCTIIFARPCARRADPVQTKQPDPLELQIQQEAKRKALAKKRAEEKLRARTPSAVAGRSHTEVQTELYLEELTDRYVVCAPPLATCAAWAACAHMRVKLRVVKESFSYLRCSSSLTRVHAQCG